MATYPKINYIGNKSKLVDWIISNMPIKSGIVVDLFSGGASVSYEFKKQGFEVISNDCLFSNYVLSKAIIENNIETLTKDVFNTEISEKDILKKYEEISKYLTNVLYYDYEVKELAKLIKISEKLNKSVVLDWNVDPDIIAGLIFNMNGTVVDNSVKHKLDNLAKKIMR